MPSEVIASHLAGIKSAFNAYKLDNRIQFPNQLLPGLSYTPEQMFFLGYAQVRKALYKLSPIHDYKIYGLITTHKK